MTQKEGLEGSDQRGCKIFPTIEMGIKVRFPVPKGLISNIIAYSSIIQYPRVCHCSFQFDSKVYDFSLNRRFQILSLDYYLELGLEEYTVVLPQLSFRDNLQIHSYLLSLENKENHKYQFCHNFIKSILSKSDTYKSLEDRILFHPSNLLWVLVEEYNGYLQRPSRSSGGQNTSPSTLEETYN